MKRLVSISLLLLYLISTTEMYQLVKVPMLVEHFLQHKGNDKSITLIEFLSIHYAQEAIIDADHADDMKLPFKDHSVHHGNIVLAIFHKHSAIKLPSPILINDKRYSLYQEVFNPSSYPSKVWQPPKFC